MTEKKWIELCDISQLEPNGGVPAMIDDQQIALFLLPGEQVFALDNYDPFSQAMVMARGIVGDKNGTPIVASPIYKQHFDLQSGQCLDDDDIQLKSWPVKVKKGKVLLNIKQIKIAA